MNTFFHESLNKHKHNLLRQCSCNVQPMSKMSAHCEWNSLTFGYICTYIMVSFSNYHFYVPSFSRVFLSCFQLYLSIYFIIICVVWMLAWLWHVSVSLSFPHHKCRSPFSLDIVNVAFTHASYGTLCIRSFWWFEGFTFVKMSWYYHINTYRTLSQFFKHCQKSVIVVVTKCIFSVALVVKSSQSCRIEGNMLLTCSGLPMLLFHKMF